MGLMGKLNNRSSKVFSGVNMFIHIITGILGICLLVYNPNSSGIYTY